MAAETYNVVRPTVRNFEFRGAGLTTTLPYMNALTFETTAEAAEITYDEPDVDADSVTITKQTLDAPVSMEAADFGAADVIQGIGQDAGRAYAASVSGLIHAEINSNGAVGNNVDVGSAMTFEHIVAAAAKLLAAKAPKPWFLMLDGGHWADLLDTGGTAVPLLNLAGMSNAQAPERGFDQMQRFGHYAGFEIYVDPHATANKSVYYSGAGVTYAWKMARVPGMAAELTTELAWERSVRAWVVSLTYFGAAKVRRAGAWAGNMYDVP